MLTDTGKRYTAASPGQCEAADEGLCEDLGAA